MSAIEWTDETWNPVTGCDRVSPGCAHCYALDLAARLKAMGQPKYQRDGDPKTSGPGFGVTLHPDVLDQPLRWRRPRMVFVNSMSDLFHEEIPDEFIEKVFHVMAGAHHHTFQVLTKRPERAVQFVPAFYERVYRESTYEPLANVWLGVSIENARYTWRADVLRAIPAAVRFISAEPLLGSLFERERPFESGRHRDYTERKNPLDLTGIDWLIVGGESGGRFARPMHPTWARELRDAALSGQCHHAGEEPCDECVAARPAFFFKQWGSWAPDGGGYPERLRRHWIPDVGTMVYTGAAPKSGGRLLDGRHWNELPRAREAIAA